MRVPYSNLSVHPQIIVDEAVAEVLKLPKPNWVCGLPTRYRCAWAWNFGPISFVLNWQDNLDHGILADTAVSTVLTPTWPICACGLPMRAGCAWAWKFGPVAFVPGTMTLTLGFL